MHKPYPILDQDGQNQHKEKLRGEGLYLVELVTRRRYKVSYNWSHNRVRGGGEEGDLGLSTDRIRIRKLDIEIF